MTPQDLLAHEWTTLQNNHERYESGGLVVKLASVALTAAGFAAHLNLKLMAALLVLLWVQEAIYRTFQSRLGQRILRVERLVKLGSQDPGGLGTAPAAAFQMHSDWAANRPGVVGLVAEYARSACKPTVAFPYAVLMVGLAWLLWR
jgi:hypothetical protein